MLNLGNGLFSPDMFIFVFSVIGILSISYLLYVFVIAKIIELLFNNSRSLTIPGVVMPEIDFNLLKKENLFFFKIYKQQVQEINRRLKEHDTFYYSDIIELRNTINFILKRESPHFNECKLMESEFKVLTILDTKDLPADKLKRLYTVISIIINNNEEILKSTDVVYPVI